MEVGRQRVTKVAGIRLWRALALESVMGAGPKIQRGSELLTVNPPKCDEYQSEDEEDEDEDETRPLTRDELKARTLNRLQRRGGGGKKKGKSKMNATR